MSGMEPFIHSVTTTVAQDVRGLVHATQLALPGLLEKDPPNWRWHLPLGFVTLVAAGVLLIAAGGVPWRVAEQQPRAAARRGDRRRHQVPPPADHPPLP